jgi:hypothetical protein
MEEIHLLGAPPGKILISKVEKRKGCKESFV